jgi:hypothetical protein
MTLSLLFRRGFFDGEMEGSARHKQLLHTSMINFIRTHAARADDSGFTFADIVAECIELCSSGITDSTFVPPEVPLGPDDDCSWIHVDPAQLDEMLLSKSNADTAKGKNASVESKLARERLEKIAAAVESDDDSDGSSEKEGQSESEKLRSQLRDEGADKMQKIVSGLNGFIERLSTIDGADVDADNLPEDDHVEFNAMLAFSKLGDAVGIEEEELFTAMQQRGWGTVDELLTLKALTDMNMNSGQDMFDGSDDESYDDDGEEEHNEEDDVDSIGLHHTDPAQRGASIAELQAAMDDELVGKACDLRVASSGQPASSRDDDSQPPDDVDSTSNLEPVDIDANLLENIMQSIRAQHGEAGPAGALLGLLKVTPPVEDLR